MTYEDTCVEATTAQGFDPIIERFATEGLPVTVEQTGGFCMVAYVRAANSPRFIGITQGDDDDTFLVCGYRDEEDDGTVIDATAPLEHVADYVRGFVRSDT